MVYDPILDNQRHLFDIPRDIAYLNCAYLSPLLRAAKSAGEQGVARKSQPWLMEPIHFFDEADRLRAAFARLIGAGSDDIALVPSASYGIETAANQLAYQKGQKILMLHEQFPSNVYPWHKKAQEHGLEMCVIPRPENGDWTTPILETLDADFAVAALPNVHWTDGSLIDLERIGKRCRELGVPLVLDVTQSLGVRPLDVTTIQPAFLAAAGYKWLLGPYSQAYLYAAPAYQSGQPLDTNWITRKGAQNFAGLVDYTDEAVIGASRYDVGERSNFALIPMALEALQQIEAWGVGNIEATLAALNDQIISRAQRLGFHTMPDANRCRHLLGLRFPEALPSGILEALKAENVFVSVRGNALRIAPHLYNDAQDVDRLFHVLERFM